IELDIKGKDVQGQSFVGVAFHGVDDTTYDAVYLRPFNFKTDDPVRNTHAVQYVSHPTYPWQKLRAEHPGEYEQPVTPAPDPNGWFHVRVVVASPKVSVFVADARQGDKGVRSTQGYAPTGAVRVMAVPSETSVLRGWTRSGASRAPRSARSRPSCAGPRPQWSDTRGPCYETAAYSASNSAASTSCAGSASTSIAPPSGASWSRRAARTAERADARKSTPGR